MRIQVRPAVVGLVLLAASHLGVPGGVAGQPEFSSLFIQQRAVSEVPEESAWREDAALGLAGDFDPVFPPVKQSAPASGSEPSVEMLLPPPLPPVAAVDERRIPAPLAPETAKPTVQDYEVDGSHYRSEE